MSIKVYTDGACKGNPGPGGWGAYIIHGSDEIELFDGNPNTTNNQMEMQAAIEALKYLKEENQPIDLYTDSNYYLMIFLEQLMIGGATIYSRSH